MTVISVHNTVDYGYCGDDHAADAISARPSKWAGWGEEFEEGMPGLQPTRATASCGALLVEVLEAGKVRSAVEELDVGSAVPEMLCVPCGGQRDVCLSPTGPTPVPIGYLHVAQSPARCDRPIPFTNRYGRLPGLLKTCSA